MRNTARNLKLIDRTGHTTLATPEVSENAIKERFESLIGANYFAYKVDGGTREQVRSWDEIGEADEVVMHAPLVGG